MLHTYRAKASQWCLISTAAVVLEHCWLLACCQHLSCSADAVWKSHLALPSLPAAGNAEWVGGSRGWAGIHFSCPRWEGWCAGVTLSMKMLVSLKFVGKLGSAEEAWGSRNSVVQQQHARAPWSREINLLPSPSCLIIPFFVPHTSCPSIPLRQGNPFYIHQPAFPPYPFQDTRKWLACSLGQTCVPTAGPGVSSSFCAALLPSRLHFCQGCWTCHGVAHSALCFGPAFSGLFPESILCCWDDR